MEKIPFNVSARTARLIGRENVANAEGALIELVKNCYDADSPIAIVLVDKPNDAIFIIDNGEGMTSKTIREQWMTIGTDNKLNSPITEAGRIKAGAKGIGRFSLDRLGEHCTMITFPKQNKIGHKWIVDWSLFEKTENGQAKKINEVYASLDNINNSSYESQLLREISNKKIRALISKKSFRSGTMLKISGLRDKWEDEIIAEVYETLELLTPPEGANKINIWLYSTNEPDAYGLVKNEEFTNYDYKLVAQYNKNKNKIKINVHRNEFDLNLIDKRLFKYPDMRKFPFDKKTFKKEHYVIERTFSELLKGFSDKKGILKTLGDFEFVFYFLKNSFSKDDRAIYKYKEIPKGRGAWLDKFGGIKLYRDNFRVRPYGEIKTHAYDWLMLGERFSQNPAAVSRKGGFRVRPNQVVGVVKFSRLTNPYLEDKSSREGLQENETFEIFKKILLGLIKVQEDDRSTIAASLSELNNFINAEAKAIEDSKIIAEEIEDEEESSQETKTKNKVLKKGVKAWEKKLKEKDEELAISRAMASAGIMIASFSHEFYRMKNYLSSRTAELRQYLLPIIDKNKLSKVPDRQNPFKIIEAINKQDGKIKQWIEFAIGLTQRDRRKTKIVNLVSYFDNFNELWNRLFQESDVKFKVSYSKVDKRSMGLKISELDLDTIFDNLITNSIEAFQRNGFHGNKKIEISIVLKNKSIIIRYIDNGPGIIKEYKNIDDIFTPFETSKKDDHGNDIGTGLGMWLVKSSVDYNKGSLELIRPKSGFELRISFKAM